MGTSVLGAERAKLIEMKKIYSICLIAAIGALSSMPAFSQARSNSSDFNRFYVRIGGGWSFGAGKMSYGTWYFEDSYREYYSHDDPREPVERHSIEEKPVRLSLGKGADVMLGFGYMFNKHIGLDISLSSVFAGKTSITSETKSVLTRDVSGFLEEHTTSTDRDIESETLGLNALYLTPAVRLFLPLGDRFAAYSRIGLSIPLMNNGVRILSSTSESSETGWRTDYSGNRETVNDHSSSTDMNKTRIKSYFNVGMNAAIGAEFAITDHFSIYAEAEAMITSFAMKEETLIAATSDGIDLLPDIPEEDRTIYYDKKHSYDENHPDNGLTEILPASSIGFNAGLIFKF